ncbi:MAG: GNAT family N-acetyltransferase [Alphaproteobacteria bacterium]|nr:GNAT family N-acetyltransferase [Alphaproteobacteria bacterium]
MTARVAGTRPPRRATRADVAALNLLAGEAYAVYLPILGRAPQPMATDWAEILDRMETWVLEDTAGTPLGSLALELESHHLVIWSVAVAPAVQGRGLGRELMRFAEGRARALGRPTLRLFTNARMTRNLALYGRLGYVETHRETLPDRVLVHMAKTLASGVAS